jgi:hypothetical protein
MALRLKLEDGHVLDGIAALKPEPLAIPRGASLLLAILALHRVDLRVLYVPTVTTS